MRATIPARSLTLPQWALAARGQHAEALQAEITNRAPKPWSSTPLFVPQRIHEFKGYGLIRLFKIVAPDGDSEGRASNDLALMPGMRVRFADYACGRCRGCRRLAGTGWWSWRKSLRARPIVARV